MLSLCNRTILGTLGVSLGWIAFFSCFLNVSYLAAPLYMMQIYDRVMRSQSVPTLLYLTIIVGLAYVTFAVLDCVRGQILINLSDALEDALSSQLFHRITTAMDRNRVRAAPTLVGRDLDTVRQFAAGSAVLAFIDLPWAPIYIVVLLMLHWALGVFAITVCSILVGLSIAGERLARGPMLQAGAVAGRAYHFGEAVGRHADCASTMGLGVHLGKRWQRLRADMLDAQNRASQRAVALSAVAKFIRMFAQSAVLGLGAYLAIHHRITGGAVFAGSLLLGRCAAPVEAVVASWRSTLSARDAFARIQAVLGPTTSTGMMLPPPSGEITLEHVTWTPAGVERSALTDITLRVEPGAVLAIVGPNATGKSTLGRVISGAIRPDSGAIRLDGAEFSSWEPKQLGQAIGYLPQNYSLFPGTIRENIARFGDVPDADIVKAAQSAQAHDMILRLPMGYQTQVDETSGCLSGGQRQRIALARALLFDPPVLVLDEPSASLDSEGETALFRCVSAARGRRRTVIVITHSAALVRIADYVGTMVDGRLMRVQPSSEFLKRPRAAGE